MSALPPIPGPDGSMEPPLDPHERYLWDRSGPVDPAVALLERAAEPLRFRPEPRLRNPRAPVTAWSWSRALAAAAVVVIGVVVLLLMLPGRAPSNAGQTWTIAKSAGATVGEPQQLKAGGSSTTRQVTTAPAPDGLLVLEAEGGTRVEVGGSAAVNIIEADKQWPWLDVRQGVAKVTVGATARPLSLGVLGEKVTFAPGASGSVTMLAKGGARVEVSSGTVEALIGQATARFAPATTSEIQPDGRMPVPVRLSAGAAFVGSVRKLESLVTTSDQKSLSFLTDQLMRFAKPADAPTIWNLLVRAAPPNRRALRDVLAKLVKAPGRPAFDDVLKADPTALNAWWRAALDAK